MSGPKPLPIDLSPEVRTILEGLLRRRACPQGLVKRVRVVLRAADGLSNRAIHDELGGGSDTIWRWRKRFHVALPRLCAILNDPENGDGNALTRAVAEALADLPRSGRPPVFTAEQLTAIIAIACEDPAASERPISHWSAREVADEAVKRKIVDTISTRHVARFFPPGRSSPAPHQVLGQHAN